MSERHGKVVRVHARTTVIAPPPPIGNILLKWRKGDCSDLPGSWLRCFPLRNTNETEAEAMIRVAEELTADGWHTVIVEVRE